jgi:hypothetical protein
MKRFASIVSGILAVLVIISSSSFTVNMHFCGGDVKSITLVEEATPCPMEVKLPPCHKKLPASLNSCCEESRVAFEGKDFNNSSIEFVSHWISGWVAEIPFVTFVFETDSKLMANGHCEYKPPLIDRDIPVLKQSFLI